MDYISVAEAAKRWGLSERSVRNYCAHGRIPGALLTGKTWNVPEDAEKPARKPRSSDAKRDVLTVLREEKAARLMDIMELNISRMEGCSFCFQDCSFGFELTAEFSRGKIVQKHEYL